MSLTIQPKAATVAVHNPAQFDLVVANPHPQPRSATLIAQFNLAVERVETGSTICQIDSITKQLVVCHLTDIQDQSTVTISVAPDADFAGPLKVEALVGQPQLDLSDAAALIVASSTDTLTTIEQSISWQIYLPTVLRE